MKIPKNLHAVTANDYDYENISKKIFSVNFKSCDFYKDFRGAGKGGPGKGAGTQQACVSCQTNGRPSLRGGDNSSYYYVAAKSLTSKL